jgi:hypothetical protein
MSFYDAHEQDVISITDLIKHFVADKAKLLIDGREFLMSDANARYVRT